MAKAKFSLVPNPTFKAVVSIPVPGGKSAEIEWTFKHRTRDNFKDFLDNMEGREDVELLLDIGCGWELDDAYDKESLEKLVQNYPGSALAVARKYISEQTGAREKN